MKLSVNRVILVVLDGWGVSSDTKYNPIAQANTPVMDRLLADYPSTLVNASGTAVGLPEGQMGNSEIGHLTLGSGRTIETDFVRISQVAHDNRLIDNEFLINVMNHTKANDGILHLIGLLGPGGVHAHDEHLMALVTAAKAYGVKNVAIHGFTDGRDTPPQSAIEYVKELVNFLDCEQYGYIASLSGRYYGMDRDNNWDRIESFLDIVIRNDDCSRFDHPLDAIHAAYQDGVSDEHLQPTKLHDYCAIRHGDGVVIFNFRTDRVKMLASKLKADIPANVSLATMTQINDELALPVLFEPVDLSGGLAEVLSQNNLKQIHIAETEKFAHVTYYFNGGHHQLYRGEKQILIDSRKDVATHDLAPEMKAIEITDCTIQAIEEETYEFILVNYANPDMVGHTANAEALKTAIETVDSQLGRLVSAARRNNYQVIITADHGNAEIIYDEINQVGHTAHTNNPVPLIVINDKYRLKPTGTIADVAPTILKIMGISPTEKMTGNSLIID